VAGRTILHEAAIRTDNDILRTILLIPGVDMDALDSFGHSALCVKPIRIFQVSVFCFVFQTL
jgi:ankyrin repeat protein